MYDCVYAQTQQESHTPTVTHSAMHENFNFQIVFYKNRKTHSGQFILRIRVTMMVFVAISHFQMGLPVSPFVPGNSPQPLGVPPMPPPSDQMDWGYHS